jgi:hypothetical protein
VKEAAMMYGKAVVVGIVTALLAPVVVVVALSVVGVGVAATGGGGIAGVSIGLVTPIVSSVLVGGFSIGFGWTLWRARAKARRAL